MKDPCQLLGLRNIQLSPPICQYFLPFTAKIDLKCMYVFCAFVTDTKLGGDCEYECESIGFNGIQM